MNKRNWYIIAFLAMYVGTIFFYLIFVSLDDGLNRIMGIATITAAFILFAKVTSLRLIGTGSGVKSYNSQLIIGEFAQAEESGDLRQGVIISINKEKGTVGLKSVDREDCVYTCDLATARVIPYKDLDDETRELAYKIWSKV